MIKYITVGPGLTTSNMYSASSRPSFPMNAPNAGSMRYNADYQTIEVYNGFSWTGLISSTPSIELAMDTKLALDWAKRKMIEEQRLDELCKKYPGLGKAKNSFETFRRLIETEEASSTIQSN